MYFGSNEFKAKDKDGDEAIRIVISVNMRKALKAPRAHHPLVGGAVLECDSQANNLSLEEQVAIYRKTVAEQTRDDIVRSEAAGQRLFAEYLMSVKSNEERTALATEHAIKTDGAVTAGVSYTGKASYGRIERYIEECRSFTNSIYRTPLLELSAMGGKMFIDYIQPFESDRYITAFTKELEKWGIRYRMRPGEKMILPKMELPWNR